MKCHKCGKEVSDTARYCEWCGTAIPQEKLSTTTTGQNDIHKLVTLLAYLGILFFLPLVVNPKSKAGAFHANQGLVLLIFSIAGQVVFKFLDIFLWYLWPLTNLLQGIYGLVMLVLMIIGMVNAYKEEQKPLPIIGGTRIL